MMLEARNVTFCYDKNGRNIVENFSIQADSSQRTGLVAPSGFGKTTICKLLGGYEKQDAGEILLDGKPLSSYGRYCPVQMIWQHPEQVINPRLRMRKVLEEGDHVDKDSGAFPDALYSFKVFNRGVKDIGQGLVALHQSVGNGVGVPAGDGVIEKEFQGFMVGEGIQAAVHKAGAHILPVTIVDAHLKSSFKSASGGGNNRMIIPYLFFIDKSKCRDFAPTAGRPAFYPQRQAVKKEALRRRHEYTHLRRRVDINGAEDFTQVFSGSFRKRAHVPAQ